MSGQPQRSMLYPFYFGKTFARRMRYVDKICFLTALLVSIILRLPYGRFWWNLVESVYRVPMLFVAAWAVKNVRLKDSTVEYSLAKTLAEHILKSVAFNKAFVHVLLLFVGSSLAFFLVMLLQLPLADNYYVLAKEFRVKPMVNDAWVYFWFHAIFCGVIYSLQHVSFQRNRLQVPYGVSCVKPDTVLFAKLAGLVLMGTSVFFAVFCSFFSPLLYIATRSAIYKACWPALAAFSLDSTMPPLHIGAGNLCNVTFASLLLFLLWEAINHVYNTYATIGCIDGKTTISSHSPDAVATLLSGLRAVEPSHQLARATAFQELAHIASGKHPDCVKVRNSIYNAHAGGNALWPAMFDECCLVIRTTSSRINYRSKSDMEALRNGDSFGGETAVGSGQFQSDLFIFGNSHDTTANDTTQMAVSATSSPLKKHDVFAPAPVSRLRLGALARFLGSVWSLVQRSFDSLYMPAATRQKEHLQAETSHWKEALLKLKDRLLASRIGVVFRPTLKRDAESRVLNPSVYGNAVIALAGLTMRAAEEDRNNAVTNTHISEVLNTLERPVRSSSNYTDFVPASVYLGGSEDTGPTGTGGKKLHLVAELHDLTVAQFFHLCVKYNYKLNDLLLTSRAFKLAKWVTELSIAQQQKEEKTQIAKFL